MEDKEYDIVIVGAGPSSMGLLYGLLSQYDLSDHSALSPDYKIAVFDRGPINSSCPNTQDIKKWFKSSHYSPSSSTVYLTPPQKGLGNRILSVPTAKGFGGGTNVNAGLVVRPAEDDFNSWPKYWQEEVTVTEPKGSQDDEWCHVMRSRMMASVVRIENEMLKNGALVRESFVESKDTSAEKSCSMRGHVNHFQHCEESSEISELDLNLSPVFSAAKVEYCTETENQTRKPKRVNFYQALLKPILDRNPHLKESIHFYANTQVERILLDSEQHGSLVATGVECSSIESCESPEEQQSPSFFRVMAKKRVILSGGAILSPSLLLLSGIGDETDLEHIGVSPLCPGQQKQWNSIGKNLKDHTITMKGYFTLPGFSPKHNNVTSVKGWLAFDISKKKEEVSSTTTSSRVFLKILDGSSSSDIIPHVLSSTILRGNEHGESSSIPRTVLGTIYHVLLFLLRAILSLPPLDWLLTNCTAVALICLLNPESKGCVKVARKGQGGEISVPRLSNFEILPDPGYFANERDHDRIEMAWNLLDKVTSSWQWFQSFTEVFPGPFLKFVWKDSLKRYTSDMTQPYFHWSGGCVMKTQSEQDYVVDETLKVRDVSNLYVCDASIVPNQISAPPALTLAGIGYTAASIFAKDLAGKEE